MHEGLFNLEIMLEEVEETLGSTLMREQECTEFLISALKMKQFMEMNSSN